MHESHHSQGGLERISRPCVGIIFFYAGRLGIDATPVEDAVAYGDLKTHECGHEEYWQHLQNVGSVPNDADYDSAPRGRSSYDSRTGIR